MEKLKRIRKERGMTQTELARRSGIPAPNISTYEAGRRRPNPENTRKLADALGVTMDALTADPEPEWLISARQNTETLEKIPPGLFGADNQATEVFAGLQFIDHTTLGLTNSLRHWHNDLTPAQLDDALDLLARIQRVQSRLVGWVQDHFPGRANPELEEITRRARELEVNAPGA